MKSSDAIAINVKPLRAGWALECDEMLEVQLFRTGGEAERSADRLAAALTKVGWFVKIVIHDLGGAIAGLKEVGPSGANPRRTIH
jgi:hypothetical protein